MGRAYGSMMDEMQSKCWNKFQPKKMNRAYGSENKEQDP